MIGKILPFIFIPISVTIPSGVVIYFVVSNLVRIGQQALVTKLDFSPKALAAAEAKREARLAAKGDVIDAESHAVSPAKAAKAPKGAKADAAPAADAAPVTTRGRRRGTDVANVDSSTKSTGNGRPSSASSVSSGRVTPPGSRPKNRKRKRK
jgi:hypothetical protein